MPKLERDVREEFARRPAARGRELFHTPGYRFHAVVTILMQGKGDDMKSFKDKMTRSEMVAVAAYIRTLGQRP